MYISMYEELFSKCNLRVWYWHCKLMFWNGAYRILEKTPSYSELLGTGVLYGGVVRASDFFPEVRLLI